MLGIAVPPVAPVIHSAGSQSGDALVLLASIAFVALATWAAVRFGRSAQIDGDVSEPKVERPRDRVPA